MVDEVVNPSPIPAASPDGPAVEVAAPSTPEPVKTDAPESIPAVETAPAPAAEPAPAEPVKVDPAPTEEKKAETLLGGDKKLEEKPAEKPAEVKEGEKLAEVKTDEAAPLPVYESFVMPEGVTFDEEKLGEFTKTLAEFETTSKASHEETQKLGQKLIDRHIAEMQRYTESLTQAWNKQKSDDWDNFLKDPEFANRTDTVANAALDAISIYGGNSEQQKEFRDLMETRGVGNHPAMIRLLANVMIAKAEPKPLAAPQIATTIKESKISKMYGKKTGS